MLVENFRVDSPDVQYSSDHITSEYKYANTEVTRTQEGKWSVKPTQTKYTFKTTTKVPKLG